MIFCSFDYWWWKDFKNYITELDRKSNTAYLPKNFVVLFAVSKFLKVSMPFNLFCFILLYVILYFSSRFQLRGWKLKRTPTNCYFVASALQAEFGSWQERAASFLGRHRSWEAATIREDRGFILQRRWEVLRSKAVSWMELGTTASEGFVWWLSKEAKASQRGSFQ